MAAFGKSLKSNGGRGKVMPRPLPSRHGASGRNGASAGTEAPGRPAMLDGINTAEEMNVTTPEMKEKPATSGRVSALRKFRLGR